MPRARPLPFPAFELNFYYVAYNFIITRLKHILFSLN